MFDSPHGLVFSRADREGLWLLGIAGGAELLVPGFRRGDFANWEVRGSSLWYRHAGRLMRLDLATRTRSVHASVPQQEDGGLTIAPDASRALFAHGDRAESDLMLALP